MNVKDKRINPIFRKEIVHIIVGSPSWEPTDSELTTILSHYKTKKVRAFRRGVQVVRHQFTFLDADHEHRLFITAGTASWTPSKEEISDIETVFEDAFNSSDYQAVLVTRFGIDLNATIEFIGESNDEPA